MAVGELEVNSVADMNKIWHEQSFNRKQITEISMT